MMNNDIRALDLKFEPLNEENHNENDGSHKRLFGAISDLRNKKYDSERIKDVLKELFGKFAIFLDSDEKDFFENGVDKMKMFIATAQKKYGIKAQEEDEDLEESYGFETIEQFILEASNSNIKAKIREFIRLYIDALFDANKNARNNTQFRNYYKSLKPKSTGKFQKTAANVNDLVRQYKQAGIDFIAHTCQASYKILQSSQDKEADVAELAKNFSERGYSLSDSDDKYLENIKDIEERMHIDAAACAASLARKLGETKDNISPYEAKSTDEAKRLADKCKRLYTKHYERAKNKLKEAYDDGMKEAKKTLLEGKSLTDPLSGTEVNREILGPVWQTGSKLNKFFSNEPWNSTTFFPKLIFGVFNLLTSDTAKHIYKGIGGFISNTLKYIKDNKEIQDNAHLWDTSIETLTDEFDEYINSRNEDKNDG